MLLIQASKKALKPGSLAWNSRQELLKLERLINQALSKPQLASANELQLWEAHIADSKRILEHANEFNTPTKGGYVGIPGKEGSVLARNKWYPDASEAGPYYRWVNKDGQSGVIPVLERTREKAPDGQPVPNKYWDDKKKAFVNMPDEVERAILKPGSTSAK